MRLLVLGAGGIGGYFGGRLAAAGVDVRFLVRPRRAAQLAETGLVIKSPLGDLTLPVKTVVEAPPSVDAVLLACKAYDLEGAMTAIAPAIGPSTCIVPLLNGVRHLDHLDARFGAERVLGGLCHIGVALGPAGEIQHLNTLQRLALGARTHSQQDAAQALHGLMERGGFAPVLSQDILQEMWEKFVFLTTYAGMTTLMRAPVGAIVQAQDGEALVRQMLGECVATAAASGYIPSQDAYARMFTTLSERGSTGTASMLRDLQRGGPTEHEHIIGDMLRRAHEARLDAPLLRVSLAHMQAYEATRMAHGGG
ncbi:MULTISPECIES: 2-dehydropantoate 2-reductase [Gammaproteobacteria]|uniref:2-dehydropantoate 2-reductase n=1 Tax=Pseudomonas triclosanedens TaxID=2961893 RepID=A0ABY7A2Y7_9PSED|nr:MULTISPECIES: 2-dehydropantoate 2-reductase [Gammaproteobacteria]ELC7284758.1 2-dehydropantoate 2-reductase [Pseudomonas aeruginosa]HBB79667.1 2-dehydropantoate 2-reductase [Pseudomonas sp.]MCO3988718.1 2-dehydropantoate 2-reductase [Pseudomonas aeruginosa]MCP8464613.1 2-dehydropantoate 2-reductase [Pseudomonas triclosanedens]WAI50906.1 2-dehydropantoate 2-reductase [Pseudomonas triclosanedens]